MNNIPKVHFYHLANILANIYDKTADYIKEEIWLCLTNSLFFVHK